MYDSVRMVAQALDDFAQIEGFNINSVNCARNNDVMRSVQRIAEYIRRVREKFPKKCN